MSKILFELPPLPYYISIGRNQYEIGEQHPNRRNLGMFDWLFVVQGTMHIGEDESQWEVGPGQSLLLLPDRYHYTTAPCSEVTVFYWIHFVYEGKFSTYTDADYSMMIRHAFDNPYKLRVPQYTAPRQFARIEHLLEQMLAYTETTSSSAYWREQQHFMDLIHLLEEDDSGDSTTNAVMRLAERTEAYLRLHYQKDLSNEMLAEALHFHPNYVVRCMKEIYQCTPMEYLMRYRLEQAKMLLLKTEWAVAHVAEHVGFNFVPYFSSCFKRHTGMSPLAWRKLHAK